jgi:hypothetical protein
MYAHRYVRTFVCKYVGLRVYVFRYVRMYVCMYFGISVCMLEYMHVMRTITLL